jgi:hypothetical protein
MGKYFWRRKKGCEAAMPRVARFFASQYTKTGKIYQITAKYTNEQYNIPNGWKTDRMDIKYNSIFHCKTLQNLPKLVFLA